MSLDSQISQCNINIEKYKALKIRLNNILVYLNSSKNASNDLKSKVSNLYQVNDSDSNIKSRISTLTNNIDTTYRNINNIVIPAIDSAINNMNVKKNNLEKAKQEEEANKEG